MSQASYKVYFQVLPTLSFSINKDSEAAAEPDQVPGGGLESEREGALTGERSQRNNPEQEAQGGSQ